MSWVQRAAIGVGLAIVAACQRDEPLVQAPANPDATETGTDAAASPPPEAAQAPAEVQRVAWPPTKLPLTVLATLTDPVDHEDRATIRDADSGVIASYRVGDRVHDGVEVIAIVDGVVELSNAGEVEYLSISPVPFELDPKDVFYPDLIDDLGTEMTESIQMPRGVAYVLRAPGHAWGTPRTIGVLRESIRSYARVHGGPKVVVGDISKKAGGPFPPHLSHQQGRDVDVGYIQRGRRKNDRAFHPATAATLDRARTWALVDSFLQSDEVAYIFMDYTLQQQLYEYADQLGIDGATLAELFQYPRGSRASHGKIRHWKGHRDHFHIRFRQ